MLILLALLLDRSAWAGDGTATGTGEGLPLTVLIIGGTVAAAAVIYRRRLWNIPRPRRIPKSFPPHTQIILAGVLYLTMVAAAGIARAIVPSAGKAESAADIAVPSAIIYALTATSAGVIVLLRSRRATGRPSGEPARRAAPITALLAAIAGLALILPIMSVAGWIVRVIAIQIGADTPELIAHSTLEIITASEIDAAFLLLAACVVLGAPFVEEVIYRMLLQDAFTRAFGHAWPGILTASFIFTLMHVAVVHWTALLPLMLFSIALGIVYERTGRLRSIVLMHAAFNLFNLVLARTITGAAEAAGEGVAVAGCASF